MLQLIAKANEAILEAQCLRMEQRSLRFEANRLINRLGETIVRSQATESASWRVVCESWAGKDAKASPE